MWSKRRLATSQKREEKRKGRKKRMNKGIRKVGRKGED